MNKPRPLNLNCDKDGTIAIQMLFTPKDSTYYKENYPVRLIADSCMLSRRDMRRMRDWLTKALRV